MVFTRITPMIKEQVRKTALKLREEAASEELWLDRLHERGYDVVLTERGKVLTTLPHGVEICRI